MKISMRQTFLIDGVERLVDTLVHEDVPVPPAPAPEPAPPPPVPPATAQVTPKNYWPDGAMKITCKPT